MFCAHPPYAAVGDAIEREFRKGTAATHNRRRLGRREFDALLAKVRRAGYADIDGDVLEGVAAASAPVFDSTGNITIALSILGPSSQVDLDSKGPHVKSLLKIAGWLSQRLGHRVDGESSSTGK